MDRQATTNVKVGFSQSLMIASSADGFLAGMDRMLNLERLVKAFQANLSGDKSAPSLRADGALYDAFASGLLWPLSFAVRRSRLHLKTFMLVGATLVQAPRRALAMGNPTNRHGEARNPVKQGQPHYDYKGHVASDESHTLIWQGASRSASVEGSPELRKVVNGDQEVVMAYKAYWISARSE